MKLEIVILREKTGLQSNTRFFYLSFVKGQESSRLINFE
ncbi:hypothetical protein NIES2098_36180 [Calothrix sp. NIES-2098]|nr:hypothetical protein NIES2098_36180 [Calothrix sp. NIES-2098]